MKTVELQHPRIRRWFGPMPGRREAYAMACVAIAIGVILCGIAVLLGFQGRTFLGRPLGGDFVEFYTIGKILNNDAPARIYDLKLATGLQHAVLPTMPDTQMLVFAQAPFIASLFRPFALLPYAWAYVAWLVFSAGLYMAALALLFRTLGLTPDDRKTGFLLALSSTPFLFETWIGGQMSVVVFAIWVLFFWCLENDRRVLAGFVLALCLFKPTLVALPALMLLVGRRWRVVGGFAAGGIAMVLLSSATVGLDGCRAWFANLALYGSRAAKTGEAWHEAKYMDLLAFFHLLVPNPALASVVATSVAIIGVVWLGRAWWRSDGASAFGLITDRRLWAATLCLTLVVNPYVPIYDSILVVIAVALVARDQVKLAGWLLLLYLVPWVTQSFAEFMHLQLMTMAVAGFAVWVMEIAGRSTVSRFSPGEEESTMTSLLRRGATRRFQVRSRGLP
jgi:hypothetical protein